MKIHVPASKLYAHWTPLCYLPTEEGPPTTDHDYKEVTDEVYSSRPDLTDVPLQNPELVLYTDGSSFIHGRRKAGYTISTTDEAIRAEALPQGWSSQQAELWALIQVLRQDEEKWANIYTDSGMPLLPCTHTGPFIKKGDYWRWEEKKSRTKKKSSSC